MQIYIDSSALVKLVVDEVETRALRAYLAECTDRVDVTSELSIVEVTRAVAEDEVAVDKARDILDATTRIPITGDIIDDAAHLSPSLLRSLDAIHLATAELLPDLTAVVTYDKRMTTAANSLGLPTIAPGGD